MGDEPSHYALHSNPVWRDRSNFIINAEVESPDSALTFEQLWVRQDESSLFEVCCIPFLVYDVALGDLVSIKKSGGREYILDSVVRESGRYVFRLWFGESGANQDSVLSRISNLGGTSERFSQDMVAIDVPDLAHAQAVADLLSALDEDGTLMYETGRTR